MVPSLFILATSVCRSLQCLISALIKRVKVVTYLGSHVQLCWEGGTNITGVLGGAHSIWTTLCLPKLKEACAFWVYTAQAAGCSAGHDPKWALGFVHFPGLSCSGSGSRVLHKGTDLVGHAFCVLPRSEQLR